METATVVRRMEFDAGHRLIGHESKCGHYHGHRYACELHVEAVSGTLDAVGRVVDFGDIKKLVGGWIDDVLDHGMILQVGDPLEAFLEAQGMKHVMMDVPPSAENIAEVIFKKAVTLLPKGLKPVAVDLWETPNCRVRYVAW